MQWLRKPGLAGRYSIYSAEGYHVSKALVGGQPVYTAWPPSSSAASGFPQALGYYHSADEAKEKCEAHYRENTMTRSTSIVSGQSTGPEIEGNA